MNRDPHSGSVEPDADRFHRRPLLLAAGTAAAGLLAGCLEDEEELEPAEPESIGDHPGPAGQVFYDDDEEPATFDSVTELVDFHDHQRQRGREKRGAFVTDYSRVEYDLEEVDGSTYVTNHADADDFGEATDLYYVVDSEVQGAMGEEFLPFSDREDADAFVDDHGGDVHSWDDLPTRSP